MTFGSLFAGIGGFDLGFERAGMKCEWQVEIDDYANKVLAKHWPHVRRHGDIRTFPPEPASDWAVDVICGGFPCQDISNSGKKSGIDGERSGLWSEFFRVIRVLRPRFVVVENVAALLVRGIGRVLGDLASIGFDAEWTVLSACAMGAPHARERLFLIAYPDSCILRTSWPPSSEKRPADLHLNGACSEGQLASWWTMEPEPCSVVYGVPRLVDRLRGFGNAVVPQIAEWIGKRLLTA